MYLLLYALLFSTAFGILGAAEYHELNKIYDDEMGAWLSPSEIIQTPPLHAALAMREFAKAKLIIEQKGDPNQLDNFWKYTPLHAVTGEFPSSQDIKEKYAGLIDMTRSLLVAKANPSIVAGPDWGRKTTPLHDTPIPEIATLLLQARASVEAPDGGGCSPLFHVRNHAVAQLLIKAKACATATTKKEVTPLHIATGLIHKYALDEQRLDLVQLLIESNANPLAASDEGLTPVKIAGTNNTFDTLTTLLTANKSPHRSYFIRAAIIDKTMSIFAQLPPRVGNLILDYENPITEA